MQRGSEGQSHDWKIGADMSGLQPSSDSFGAVTQADGLGWDNGAPLALS